MPNDKPKELFNLHQFTGTETWWRHPLYKNFSYTDGMRHVAQTAEAYWLLDVIFSHAAAIERGNKMASNSRLFLVFNLTVAEDNSAKFITEDGNKNTIKEACQAIPYTDFPAQTFTCWMVDGVCMLPSEY